MAAIPGAHKVVKTTYADFLAGKTKDNYHSVMMVQFEHSMTEEEAGD